jgi:phage shock protein PspC (stress-responsive transcriptional regulator)
MQANITNLESNIEKINNINNNLNSEINNLDNQIIELKRQVISSDIGTYKFIAEAFNVPIEAVVKWFILFIVVVFDPLAVCLILAYNIASFKKTQQPIIENTKTNIIEKIIEKPIEVYKEYKRGTKRPHNPNLADPNIK